MTTADYKHKKQTGGHGQYGHVVLELAPLPRGSGTEFAEKIVGGSIPKNFIPAVEKGVHEGVQEGVLCGYPVEDVRITAIDGSFHPVDSSEICFKIAGAGAVKKGLQDGKSVLLEPIFKLKVTAPDSYTGDIISDLNTKRGQVQGMLPEDGINIIEAIVPLAESSEIRYESEIHHSGQRHLFHGIQPLPGSAAAGNTKDYRRQTGRKREGKSLETRTEKTKNT